MLLSRCSVSSKLWQLLAPVQCSILNTIHHMEFICFTSKEVQDLAKKMENCQPVGYHPEVSVLAAEKRYKWFMNILCSDEGGLLGIIQEHGEEQSIGTCCYGLNQELLPPMLLWLKCPEAITLMVATSISEGTRRMRWWFHSI